jgi:hypothetical protein
MTAMVGAHVFACWKANLLIGRSGQESIQRDNSSAASSASISVIVAYPHLSSASQLDETIVVVNVRLSI